MSICKCGAQLDWLEGLALNTCDEPCRFIMEKSGEGKPPIPTQEYIEGYRAAIYESKNAMSETEMLAFIVKRVKLGITKYDKENKGNIVKVGHFASGFQAIYYELKKEGYLDE